MFMSQFVRSAALRSSTTLTLGKIVKATTTNKAVLTYSLSLFVEQRSFTTVIEAATAGDALKYSGYSAIDFTINEDATVFDAVQKFAAFNIGCLVTTDAAGMLIFLCVNEFR